jgi:hypothetical protein
MECNCAMKFNKGLFRDYSANDSRCKKCRWQCQKYYTP